MPIYPGQVGLYPDSPVAYPEHPGDTGDNWIPPPPVWETPTLVEPATVQAPEWSFLIGAATGGMTHELTRARSRKCSFKLTEPSEVSCEVDGRHPEAAHLIELATDLHVLRAPQQGARKERLYRGRIGKSGDTFDTDTHSVTVPSLDYRAVLQRRHLLHGSQQVWTQQDQAAIAFGLIQQAQRLPGGDYGIVMGSSPTGVLRDRSYDLGDNIGERIQELSEVIDGFDWDVTSTSDTGLQLDIWHPQRGVTLPGIVLEFGGAVASGSRTVDSGDYANHIRVTGSQPEGGGDGPQPEERPFPGTPWEPRPEGRWDKTYGEPITTQPALAERADWLLDQAQVVTPTYSLKLRRGWWRGPGHLWLGDAVTVRIRSGRLRVNTQLRVHQVDVDISDDGTEDVTLTVGGPKPDYRRRAAEIEKRLASLERR